ncbi:cysteine--tRNA ligase [Frankia sp. CNm7]|uniref:Cysteine--tRNA ligase n=1 Tax=Frankia nepalensis TaxID=1836974 RepID=A0A937RSF3_9ACTN|nr:cysteine--tRNA ligase [Frankia nepalensis]MBL7502512.1 cysteine--tRNA ligase [Frankia nepalensis]MBL7515680.1 cysteine--tRNA ligase [Frankia nepalensis]MBL7518125.1 cysteine--tRNA ligase [Frankia nepalensis]MBL7631091.1 cysteine--tRNA ligase [Frankia nepalensis]
MSLHLYDTRTRRVRPFKPLRPGHVGVYVCGPTVQSAPHVGHLRSAVALDLLRRWLLASDYEVTYVQNVTDIDDKIIVNADREGVSVWELATRETRAFDDAYRAVGVLPPTIQPRATGHIPEMHALVAALMKAGFAYEGDGSVWFRVGRYADYGALSNQRPEAMQASPEAEPGKADPRDFALWKAVKPGEPAWDSPWGPGRPGWHLECSAMAGKYLGPVFDIHGGGLDLVFPHHENERAQTVCAAGHGGVPTEAEMARYWIHVGLLTTGGTKMSKSLGNSFFVTDVLGQFRPQALRFHLISAHYRSSLEYTVATLTESAAAYERVETFVRNALDILGGPEAAAALAAETPAAAPRGAGKAASRTRPRAATEASGDAGATPGAVVASPEAAWAGFAAALDDDLGVARALAALFGAVSQGNQVLSKAHSRELAGWVVVARRMLTVLGLDPVEQWPAAGGQLRPALDGVMEIMLDLRSSARARRDYAEADSIRARLGAAGIVVDDTPEGQRWHLA